MAPGGFADLRREASVRPSAGDPPARVGVDTSAIAEGLSESQQRFLGGLSQAARETALRHIANARHRDPRKVPQAELDRYDDDTKWSWLEEVCRREAADKEQAAALAAQTEMEGHHA